jgi:hypothetical protein
MAQNFWHKKGLEGTPTEALGKYRKTREPRQ